MFFNQAVFFIIFTQCKPEVSGLGQCDSGTCMCALVSPSVPGSMRDLTDVNCKAFI
jgi:hypothetical protein